MSQSELIVPVSLVCMPLQLPLLEYVASMVTATLLRSVHGGTRNLKLDSGINFSGLSQVTDLFCNAVTLSLVGGVAHTSVLTIGTRLHVTLLLLRLKPIKS